MLLIAVAQDCDLARTVISFGFALIWMIWIFCFVFCFVSLFFWSVVIAFSCNSWRELAGEEQCTMSKQVLPDQTSRNYMSADDLSNHFSRASQICAFCGGYLL